jgi:hypothetical protein
MIYRRFLMAKRDRYESDEQFEQSDFNYYYFPPMFRSPEEYDEDYRADANKKAPVMPASMGPNSMPMGMEAGMMTDGDLQSAMPSMTGIEPGMEAGLESATLPGLGINPATSMQQPSVFDPAFLQGYLRRHIGRRVRIEFLIGTQMMTDRTGTIVDVGISYVTLRDDTGSEVICDMYSIKFVIVFPR